MPGPGSGRQAEGVSSLSKRPFLILYSIGNLIYLIGSKFASCPRGKE